MTPLISVIVPVYNSENYLRRCVESVEGQSYTQWQLILVDDGSKDNSLQICQEYAKLDNRILSIHQENSGPGIARNIGMDKAKGEYVVFLDSDDYLTPNYFDLLSRHKEDVVFIDLQAVDEIGKVVRNEFLSDYKDLQKDDFLRAQMTGKINWGGVRKAAKRELLEKYNIRYSHHKIAEEAIFSYNVVFYANTISFIDKPVYFYVQREDSQSHLKMDDPWGDVALTLREEAKANKSYPNYGNTLNAFILTAAAVSANCLASNYSWSEYKAKFIELTQKFSNNLDHEYSIDYIHMSGKAKVLGYFVMHHHSFMVWLMSMVKKQLL